MAKLTKQQVADIIAKRPEGTSPVGIIAALRAQGHELEGYPSLAKQPIDYAAIEKEQSKPTLTSDPKGWWKGLKDEEKQAVLDNIGEFAGGTVGAMAGGGSPLSIPAAGAGALAGKKISQLVGEKVLGYKSQPKTAGQELLDDAKTFGVNAAGEGVGRGVSAVAGMAKRGVKNAVKRTLMPTAEGRATAALADTMNVPVTPGMVSPAFQKAENALARFPTSEGVIEQSKMQGMRPLETRLQKIAEPLHPPGPVSDIQAGEAAQAGLEANRIAAKAHFTPRYNDVTRMAGNAPIGVSPMQVAGAELLQNIPEDAHRFFPAGSLAKIRQAAQLQSKSSREFAEVTDQVAQQLSGKPFQSLQPADQNRVLSTLKAFGIHDLHEPPTMTFEEAQQLRTQLLEAERHLSRHAPAVDRSALPKLRKALDQSIEESLSGSPEPKHQQALEAWRNINKDYRQTSQTLYPPRRPGGEGNPTSRIIEQEKYPEKLPARLTASETPVSETEQAMAHNLSGTPNESEGVMGKLRRNYADNMVEDARVQAPSLLADERLVSPRRLEKILDTKPVEAVIGPQAYQSYRDAVRVGKAVLPRDINPSGTARTTEYIREARRIGGAGLGLGIAGIGMSDQPMSDKVKEAAEVAAALYAPRLAARAITNPALTRRLLTMAPEALTPRLGGAVSGAAGRLGALAAIPSPNPIDDEDERQRQRTLALE